MIKEKLKLEINELKKSITTLSSRQNQDSKFAKQLSTHQLKQAEKSISGIIALNFELSHLVKQDPKNRDNISRMILESAKLNSLLEKRNFDGLVNSIIILEDCCEELIEDENSKFIIPNLILPKEISENLNADIHELKKCFENQCFRSSMILCGRILEVALHRKYFEVTGKDILEDFPGIGLGKLVAKLDESGVNFSSALMQQIHLVNSVRVASVHKKQDELKPTKDQTLATIIFTFDVLKQIFH